jgi:hypothetical protein
MTFERLIRPDLVLSMDFLSMSGFNACTWERMNASNVCCSRMKLNRPGYQGGQLV